MGDVKLLVGEKVEVKFQLADGSFSSSSFDCEIKQVVSDTEFNITPPVDNDISKWIGRIIRITVPRNDGAYFAEAKIVKQVNVKALELFQIQLLGELIRIQRREFNRLKVSLDVDIEGFGPAKTVDISGNGMAILSEVNFEDGELLQGKINLEGNFIEFSGVVVRSKDVSEQYNLVCTYFNQRNRELQDKIVNYINDRLA